MIVVKLGGSLLDGDEFAGWIDTLARNGAGRAVVVPGGGPFADAVRRAQRDLRFDDRTAHRMALLAMDQLGMLLCALHDTFRPVRSMHEFRPTLREGAIPVWLPSAALAEGVQGIRESWEVTSDSLAAWLAGRLGATQLALVKSAPPPPGDHAQLARTEFVDAAFPAFARGCNATVEFLGPGQQPALRAMLCATGAQCSPVSQG